MYALQNKEGTIQITKKVTTLGRHLRNDVVVNSLRVSRYHSEITVVDGKIFLKDRKTVNGTYIGNYRLLPEREILLKVGDTIGIGCKASEEAVCTFEIVPGNSEIVDDVSSSTHENVVESDRVTPRPAGEIAEPSSTSDVNSNELRERSKSSVSSNVSLNSNNSSIPSTTVCESTETNVCLSNRSESAATPISGAAAWSKASNTAPKFSFPFGSSEHCKTDSSANNEEKTNVNPKLEIAFGLPLRNNVDDGSGDFNKVQSDDDKKANETDKNVTLNLLVPHSLPDVNQSVKTASSKCADDVIHISDSEDSISKISEVTDGQNEVIDLITDNAEETGAAPTSKGLNLDAPIVDADVINLIIDSEDGAAEETFGSIASSREKSKSPVANDDIINLMNDSEDAVGPEKVSSLNESSCSKIRGTPVDRSDVIDLLHHSQEKEPIKAAEVSEVDLRTLLKNNKSITIFPVNGSSKRSEKEAVAIVREKSVPHKYKETSSKTAISCKRKEKQDREPVLPKIKESSQAENGSTHTEAPSKHDILPDVPPAPKIPPLRLAVNPFRMATDPFNEFKIPSPYHQRYKKKTRRDRNVSSELASDKRPNEVSAISNPRSLSNYDNAAAILPSCTNRNSNEIPFVSDAQPPIYDVENPSDKLNLPTIDLSMSDDEEDIKPFANPNYSNLDEIITLDSDEEDFPSSQLNATQLNNVPDFSTAFERIFDDPDVAIKDEILHCNENTWFDESLTGNDLVEGKRMRKANVFSSESSTDSDGNMDDYEPPIDEASFDYGEKELADEAITDIKHKYGLKECFVKLPNIDVTKKLHKKRKSDDNLPDVKVYKKMYVEKSSLPITSQEKYTVKKRKKRKSDKNQLLRQIKKDNYKIANVNRVKNQTVSQIQRHKKMKELRKEKLKEIARPTVENVDPKIIQRPETKPVVKVTNKNRNEFLIESMVDEGSARKKERIEKIVFATNDVDIPIALTEPVIPLLEVHTKTFDSTNEPSTSTENNKFSSTSGSDDVERLMNLYCSTSLTETPPSAKTSVKDKPRTVSKSPAVAQKERTTSDCGGVEDIEKLLDKAMESSEQTRNKTDDVRPNVTERLATELSNIFIMNKKENRNLKSNLKINGPVCEQTTKKVVRFQEDKNQYRYIRSDHAERRNNGIFAPAFKLNEHLIREAWLEFEAAVTKVCSWNVRWLEEQQKCAATPPLYPEGKQINDLDLIGKYKEHVKGLMFRSLWRSMFHTWNMPNNDFLPHTQLMPERNTLYSLQIEKVDTATPNKQLWTIHASRVLNAYEKGDDISSGQIVIINFYVRTKPDENPRKTIIFTYIANILKVPISGSSDGCSKQKIAFKIKAKPFTIVMGEIKMKVLNYLKTLLRPFQALAMVLRSPLTCLIIDPEPTFPAHNYFKNYEDILDKFLDASQRKAIASCLNCMHSDYPSISIVNGSAGTGKSQVIVSLLHQIFAAKRHSFPDDLKILIVSASDYSADDLTYRLETLNKKEKCINLLRYGNCKGMHALMKNCTLDQKIQDLIKNDNSESLINLEEEVNNLRAKMNSFKLVLKSEFATQEKKTDAMYKLSASEKELNDMVSENSKVIERLKSQAAKEVSVENADVIITTTFTCWSSNFENDFVPTNSNKGDVHKFTVCIFDDANHINETGMLIPMMLMVRSLILIGDSRNQLLVPAEKSPFSRLRNTFVNNKLTNNITELENQYRMHPSIMEWIDQNFKLNCQYKIVPGIKQKITPFLVVNLILTNESNMNILHEEQNIACARLIVKIDQHYDQKGRFGLIVAHGEQRDSIKSLLLFGAYGTPNKKRKLFVDTIDSFNGREPDMVLLCLPYDANLYEKWLYVAMTRAKDCLIICGDFSRISPQESIESLVRFAKNRNVYTSWNPMSNENFPTAAFTE